MIREVFLLHHLLTFRSDQMLNLPNVKLWVVLMRDRHQCFDFAFIGSMKLNLMITIGSFLNIDCTASNELNLKQTWYCCFLLLIKAYLKHKKEFWISFRPSYFIKMESYFYYPHSSSHLMVWESFLHLLQIHLLELYNIRKNELMLLMSYFYFHFFFHCEHHKD